MLSRKGSGSVYRRFPNRAALLAVVWNRAVQRFRTELYPLFAGEQVSAAAALGRRTVAWCRANPADARVLLIGSDFFEPAAWPADERRRREEDQARGDRHVHRLVTDLKAVTGRRAASKASSSASSGPSSPRPPRDHPNATRPATPCRCRSASRSAGHDGKASVARA